MSLLMVLGFAVSGAMAFQSSSTSWPHRFYGAEAESNGYEVFFEVYSLTDTPPAAILYWAHGTSIETEVTDHYDITTPFGVIASLIARVHWTTAFIGT